MGCQGLPVHDKEDVGRDADADSAYRTKWTSFSSDIGLYSAY